MENYYYYHTRRNHLDKVREARAVEECALPDLDLRDSRIAYQLGLVKDALSRFPSAYWMHFECRSVYDLTLKAWKASFREMNGARRLRSCLNGFRLLNYTAYGNGKMVLDIALLHPSGLFHLASRFLGRFEAYDHGNKISLCMRGTLGLNRKQLAAKRANLLRILRNDLFDLFTSRAITLCTECYDDEIQVIVDRSKEHPLIVAEHLFEFMCANDCYGLRWGRFTWSAGQWEVDVDDYKTATAIPRCVERSRPIVALGMFYNNPEYYRP